MTTDQIPADKVREILDEWERIKEHADWDDIDNLVQDVRALLPTPPRPTLADMTDQERDDAVGMWADVEGFHPYRAIIDAIPAPKVPVFKPTAGSLDWVHPADVTPLPELGRAWSPGGIPIGTPAPAPAPALPEGWRLADHKDNGRVIVTNTTPTSDGRVYYVLPAADPRGYDWLWCGHSELTYIDQEDDTSATEGDGTPTEPDHLAVGTVIESADDPRIDALPLGTILLDRNEEATTKRPRPWGWTGLGNTPAEDEDGEPGPWTVLHIPKESDQ